MRAVAAAAALLLASCGSSGDRQQGHASRSLAPSELECAVDGASQYEAGCTIERASTAAGAILTIRSPTGSFRRLRVSGGGVAAADGAEPARMLAEDSKRIEVAIGRDRYRIPREALR